MASTLRGSLTRYIDHLEDAAWVRSLVVEHGVDAILRQCAIVLAGGQADEVHEVTTFLRDVGIRGIFSDDLVTTVRATMPKLVMPSLRRLLRAPTLQARTAAIYTLGKLSFREEAKALRAVFPSYLSRDPFCLARLLGELAWLGDRRGAQARLERVVAHNSSLVRWSALGYLSSASTPSEGERRLLRALSSDPEPLVAAEAECMLAEAKLEDAGRKARWCPKVEWRNRRRALEKAAPSVTFSMIETWFTNEMATTGKGDYALDELAQFVHRLRGAARD